MAVKTFTEWTCRRGDIHFRYDAATDSAEGIEVQRRVQRDRGVGYQREVKLEHRVDVGGFSIELAGRADGVQREGVTPIVEEFKATRHAVAELHAQLGHLHLAQLKCYAAMLAAREPDVPAWGLRLVYVHPDTLMVTPFDSLEPRSALLEFLEDRCAEFGAWLAGERLHRSCRDAQLTAVAFPHAAFRPAQRRLASAVYRSLRDRRALLMEAPTGCGKTVATLFPALKAMAEGRQDRVVYLTARTTGQRAAEDALGLIHGRARFRQVTLTAKQQICFMPEPVCDPELCRYARGYYERRPAAVRELLDGGMMDRARIEAVAAAHTVCPFELSLDAATWSDVIVGDYNYVFDPVVRLQRLRGLFAEPAALLIDEAHQLADRTRAMLSTVFPRATVRAALREDLPAILERGLRSLDRRLLALRREAQREGEHPSRDFEQEIACPDRLVAAAATLIGEIRERVDELSMSAALSELTFALWRLVRAADWYDQDRFVTVLRSRGREVGLELVCLDPSAHIAERLGEFAGSVRFSATLSPPRVFQALHGVSGEPAVQLPSPFPAEHLDVAIVPDVSVLYRDRERTLDAVADLIATVVSARPGNYLVALPSYAYLGRAADAFAARHPEHPIDVQAADSTPEDRQAFIGRFTGGNVPRVGFVVMGGVFTESVDLPGEALIGVVVVGTALPPRSLERERIARANGPELGFTVAYQQPAMTRVVQTAGRLIRSASDRGVLCLVDRRFLAPEYQRFFPPHWRPTTVPARRLPGHLRRFWSGADAAPPDGAACGETIV